MPEDLEVVVAKGFDVNRRRQEELNMLGRELTRRSGSKCELCSSSGGRLNVVEVPPAVDSPVSERAVFICNQCLSGLPDPLKNEDHWRCLNESIWSDIKPVVIISAIILKKLAKKNSWAGDILEEVYLDDDDMLWIESSGI